MGGSSKPADPKVTPFQEPAAPSNPIPNFFGGRGATGYKPDFTASQGAFGARPQGGLTEGYEQPQPMQQAMPQAMPDFAPQSAPVAPMQQQAPMMPFAIPTGPVAPPVGVPAYAAPAFASGINQMPRSHDPFGKAASFFEQAQNEMAALNNRPTGLEGLEGLDQQGGDYSSALAEKLKLINGGRS